MFIFDLLTLAVRQEWQFFASLPSKNLRFDDPADGTLPAAPSAKPFVILYFFREVFRDVAIVSIDCFWVEDE